MKTNLSIVHDATFWPFHSWAEFSLMPDREKKVVIIPVVSFSDWEMEAPLDFEEVLTMSLLKKSLASIENPSRFLVIPPLRFNMGRKDSTFFRVDPETAHATLEDVAGSIHAHGFRKILFLNSSPWNEDLVDSGGRDLRIKLGLQPFCIYLSSLGLDFRSPSDRPRVHSIRDYLLHEDEKGAPLLAEAADGLFSLLEEVYAFRPLPNDGRIPQKKFNP